MAAKKTSKKAPAKSFSAAIATPAEDIVTATVAPPVQQDNVKAAPKKSGSIAFFFPNENPAFNFKDDKNVSIRIKAKNKTLILNEGKDDYAINMLRKDKGNKANGGVRFAEIEMGKTYGGKTGDRIDDLIGLEIPALVAMAGGEFYMYQLSKGNLIALILELD